MNHESPSSRVTLYRWAFRLACSVVFFVIFLYATPPLYAVVNIAELTAAMRTRGWDRGLTYGDGGRSLVHHTCNTDADCGGAGGGGGNTLICKTLTITYGAGGGPGAASAPSYTTKRCEATHCPSPFSNYMANGNPNMPVEQMADILLHRGADTAVTIPVPSPAVNPWDPNYSRCKTMEAETAAGCHL
ncbi:MAG TPA: hypothetical protein VLC10_04240 [Patescibacteria group bacterium]|nr:hypothetical protein [Patescibacteria group bacterium]